MARLTPCQRLRVPGEFRRVFADPLKVGDSHVTVLARPNDRGHARLGLAAARRHLRRAVDRNRFKRIVRESFRAHQDRLGAVDVVVIARPAAAGADRRSLRAGIDRQWSCLRRRLAGSRNNIGSHG